MRALAWITCLWPGLSRLWLRGELSGLLTAAAFTVLLQVVLVASFVWPELLRPAWLAAGWLLLACCWCCGAWRSFRRLPELVGPAGAGVEEDLFIQAQAEYLRGHWFEAESLLRRLVRGQRDADAHLLLVALYRRTKRWAEAGRELRLLERLDGADKWRWEMDRERRQLEQLQRVAQEPSATGGGEGACEAA